MIVVICILLVTFLMLMHVWLMPENIRGGIKYLPEYATVQMNTNMYIAYYLNWID
jgi:hypothetical protein